MSKYSDYYDEWVEIYQEGEKDATTIGKMYGCNYNTVINLLRKRGIEIDHGRGRRKLSYDRDYFNKINTKEKAYWLGFIYADGYIGNRRLIIDISHKDVGHLHKFVEAIKAEDVSISYRESRDTSKLDLSSVDMVRDLENYGLLSSGNKGENQKPWNGDDDLMIPYWRGVVDGDGWLSIDTYPNCDSKRCSIALCGNINMVNGFREFVQERTGIDVKPVKYKEEKYRFPFYHVAYMGSHYPITVADLLYENSNIHLDRKYDKYQRFKHSRSDVVFTESL